MTPLVLIPLALSKLAHLMSMSPPYSFMWIDLNIMKKCIQQEHLQNENQQKREMRTREIETDFVKKTMSSRVQERAMIKCYFVFYIH